MFERIVTYKSNFTLGSAGPKVSSLDIENLVCRPSITTRQAESYGVLHL